MRAFPFQEIFLDPLTESRRVGVRVGDFVVLPFLEPSPKQTLPAPARTESQLSELLSDMTLALAVAGASRADVVRVTVFMRDVLERPTLNAIWEQSFPDGTDRPPHKYVPAMLTEGVNVAIQVFALCGAHREVLEIPGVQHVDPMAMGVVAGKLVASSRLFGSEPDVARQTRLILQRAEQLMAAGGGRLEDLTQATFFVGSPEIGAELEEHLEAHWRAATRTPEIHIIEADLGGGNGFPRVEILGLLAGTDEEGRDGS